MSPDYSFLPIFRSQYPILVDCDTFSENRVAINANKALDALFGPLNSLGWKFRQYVFPRIGYFDQTTVVLIPEKERVAHSSTQRWDAWKTAIDANLPRVSSDKRIICAGRAPLALWTLLGSKISAQDVTVINFPIRSERQSQVFHVKGQFSAHDTNRPNQLHVSEFVLGKPVNNPDQFLFVTLEPAYSVDDTKLSGMWKVTRLAPSKDSQWKIESQHIPELLAQITQHINHTTGNHVLGIANSGPDSLAFLIGLAINSQKVSRVDLYEFVGAKYEVAFRIGGYM